MHIMKRLMFLIALMTGVTAAFADCTFTDVIVRQHWPWNPKVEVEMAVAGTGGRRHLVKIAAYSGGTLLGEIPGGKPVACDSRLTFTFDPTKIDFLKDLGAIHDFRVVPSARQVVDIPCLIHRWTFNNTLEDEVGGQDATAKNANLSAKTVSVTGGENGTSYVELGANALPKTGSVTVEFWVSRDKDSPGTNQGYLFDIGSSSTDRLSFVPRFSGINSTQVAIENGGYASLNQTLSPAGSMTAETMYHVAIVLVPTAEGGTTVTAYLQDVTTGATLQSYSWSTPSKCSFSRITQDYCSLGRSCSFSSIPDIAATYDEVRVWNVALTEEELKRNAQLGPDALPIP